MFFQASNYSISFIFDRRNVDDLSVILNVVEEFILYSYDGPESSSYSLHDHACQQLQLHVYH